MTDNTHIDVTKYDAVIRSVLSKLKVRPHQKEDMKQECYLELLEHQEALLKAGDGDEIVARGLCKTKIIDIYREENQYRPTHKTKHGVRMDSMSDPHVEYKALSIPQLGGGLADEQLYAAIMSLEIDEYRVIYSIYVDGKTQETTGRELGLTRWQVRTTAERGIKNLKKYFEV